MSDDFPITIFHNPGCGTSRNTLAMIRAAGYEPTVVEYLKTGWTRAQLEGLLEHDVFLRNRDSQISGGLIHHPCWEGGQHG